MTCYWCNKRHHHKSSPNLVEWPNTTKIPQIPSVPAWISQKQTVKSNDFRSYQSLTYIVFTSNDQFIKAWQNCKTYDQGAIRLTAWSTTKIGFVCVCVHVWHYVRGQQDKGTRMKLLKSSDDGSFVKSCPRTHERVLSLWESVKVKGQ